MINIIDRNSKIKKQSKTAAAESVAAAARSEFFYQELDKIRKEIKNSLSDNN